MPLLKEGLPTLVRLAACAGANFPANTEDYGFSSPSLLSLGYGGLAEGAEGFVTLVREDLDIQGRIQQGDACSAIRKLKFFS
jgi:hypothetical protein